MSRHWSRGSDGVWLGVISCARPRCREQHIWSVDNPPADRMYSFGRSPEEQGKIKQQDAAASQELEAHPLPAGWVRLKYMLYREGVSGNPDFFEFHSPHCAALYLDSLPDAKGNQDPRRVHAGRD